MPSNLDALLNSLQQVGDIVDPEKISNLWPDAPKPGQMIPTWDHLQPTPQPQVKDPTAVADFLDSITSGQYGSNPQRMTAGVGTLPQEQSSTVNPTPLGKPVASDSSASGSYTPELDTSPVAQAIKSKYGFGNGLDDDALKAAQDNARSQSRNAMIGDALATIISGVSGQGGKIDDTFYNNLAKSGDKKVEDILQRRQAAVQEQGLKKQQELEDPESQQSKAFQNTVLKLYGDKFSPEDVSRLSASDAELVFKPLQLAEQIEARKQQSADNLALRKLSMQQSENDKRTSRQQSAQNSLNTDEEYKDSIKGINEANKLDQQADLALTNPRAASQLPIQIARTLTSRVNERELQASGGSESILDTANRMSKRLSDGTMTKTDYNQLKEWIGTVKKSELNNRDNAVSRHVTQFSRLSNQSPEQSAFDLGVNLPSAPSKPTSNQKYAPGSVVNYKGKNYRVGADGDSLEPM